MWLQRLTIEHVTIGARRSHRRHTTFLYSLFAVNTLIYFLVAYTTYLLTALPSLRSNSSAYLLKTAVIYLGLNNCHGLFAYYHYTLAPLKLRHYGAIQICLLLLLLYSLSPYGAIAIQLSLSLIPGVYWPLSHLLIVYKKLSLLILIT